MSDKPNPSEKPYTKRQTRFLIILLAGIIVMGSIGAFVIYYVSINQSEQIIEPVEIIEPVSKMNRETFDRCVALTIEMVKAYPYDDGKSVEYTSDKDVVDKRIEWKLLDCASGDMITEANEWKHRNDSP